VIIHSLALQTELALAATRGRVIDRGDYLVIVTPDDPGYYAGNVLVLRAAPQVGEVAYWTRRFHEELGADREIRHVTLWWDGIRGDLGAADELHAAGFTLSITQLMVATELAPPTATPGAPAIRALAADEIARTADLAWAIGDRHDERYRQFLHRRAAWHAELVARGSARFWGAHDAGALVASLGLVSLGPVARYQDVQTVPSHRGRGLASALLVASAREALAGAVERVAIVAEPDSQAARVYARVGFRELERVASACRVPS
jgi:GNAT superfamily N-acetyltransferase